MKVSDILRVKGNTLFTVTPDHPLSEAITAMAENDIGSLVVMDHGRLVGMLTFREVLAAMHRFQSRFQGLAVQDVMLKEPRSVGPDMEVDDLRRTMLETHARYMPVMDGSTLTGVLSFHDVAKAVLEEQSFENRMLKGYIKNWPD